MRNFKRHKIITAIAVPVFLACAISACKRIPTASGKIWETGTTQETPYTEQTQQTDSRLQAEGEPQTESRLQVEVEPQTESKSQAESESLETPESEAPPKETDALSSEDYIRQKLSSMTLMEKVCQMFFVTPESIAGITPVTSCGEEMKNALERYPVGGIIFSTGNLQSKDQVKQMLIRMQESAQIGMFLSADEEGGTVNRLMKTVGTTYVGAMYDYRDEGTAKAYENAFTIASDMSALGFNLDFAPVADVWSNPENTVIGKRAYSNDCEEAARLIEAAVRGFHDGGVMCTLKHFPGHGDTASDSHYESAYVNKTRQEIEAQELLPFAAGIENGAEFVMVGHLIVADISTKPATLSYTVIQEILREEMGFDGIVITDAMAMSALSEHYSVEEMTVQAIEAGNDMLLMPPDVPAAVNAVLQAVKDGRISEERIDESVERILEVKLKKEIWKP